MAQQVQPLPATLASSEHWHESRRLPANGLAKQHKVAQVQGSGAQAGDLRKLLAAGSSLPGPGTVATEWMRPLMEGLSLVSSFLSLSHKLKPKPNIA